MIKLTEKQVVLLLYGIAVLTGIALMLCLPRLGYDIREDFTFIALTTLSIPLIIFAIGSIIILIKFKYIKLNF